MSIRTPLARVRGAGSARSGTREFWHQRLTSLASIPLTIAFVIILIGLLWRGHSYVVQILGSPLVAIVMLLFVVTMIYHMKIGMQEIIVDYVHDDFWKYLCLIGNLFFSIAVGAACVYALLKLSFGV